MRIIRVDPREPSAPRSAIEIIRSGGLIVYPTDTVYGLGADALDQGAVAKVFGVKGRPGEDPLPVLIADEAQVDALAVEVPDAARRLFARFWPGALTVVLRRSLAVPAIVSAGRMTIALRVPDVPVVRALIREAGRPLTGTSANPHGMVPPTTAIQAATMLGDRVDLYLDGGSTPGPIPSTVVDVTADPPQVVRLGVVSEAAIREALRRSAAAV